MTDVATPTTRAAAIAELKTRANALAHTAFETALAVSNRFTITETRTTITFTFWKRGPK